MFMAVTGKMGSGKTVALLHFIELERFLGKEIIYHGIDFSEYHYFRRFDWADWSEYLDNPSKFSFVFDGPSMFTYNKFDHNRSKFLRYFLGYHKKGNFSVYVAFQHWNDMDRPFKHFPDHECRCSYLREDEVVVAYIENLMSKDRYKVVLPARKIYRKYIGLWR